MEADHRVKDDEADEEEEDEVDASMADPPVPNAGKSAIAYVSCQELTIRPTR